MTILATERKHISLAKVQTARDFSVPFPARCWEEFFQMVPQSKGKKLWYVPILVVIVARFPALVHPLPKDNRIVMPSTTVSSVHTSNLAAAKRVPITTVIAAMVAAERVPRNRHQTLLTGKITVCP